MSAYGRMSCQTHVNVKRTDSLLSRGQMEIHKTHRHCSVALSKVIFLFICKFKTNFIASS